VDIVRTSKGIDRFQDRGLPHHLAPDLDADKVVHIAGHFRALDRHRFATHTGPDRGVASTPK